MIVLGGIVPVFAIIGLGVLARRMGWIDRPALAQLNRVIYLMAIPALLLRLIGSSPLRGTLSGPLVGSCVAATLLVGAATWLVVAVGRAGPERRGVLVQACVRGNLAYVAFPVILASGGEAALRIAAVTAVPLILLQNLISIAALAAGRGGRLTDFARVVLLNPVVLGAAGGIAWSLSGWAGWVWLNRSLDILADLALPGALLALGGQLELEGVRDRLRVAGTAAAVKVVLLPLVGLVLLRYLGVDPLGTLVGVFLLAAPTAAVSAAIAQSMGGDSELAGAAVVTASLASFPAYIVWALVL